jgi:transcriptional regulator with XRE-family HTH domain
MPDVGRKIRELRRAKEWTLDELSSRSGLSAGFLSQVERGLSSLSIVSLERVCDALGVSLSELLGAEQARPEGDSESCKVVAASRQWIVRIPDSAISYRHLTARLPRCPFEVLINEFPKDYYHPSTQHRGEEFGYVLEGTLSLVAGEETHHLDAGDCYYLSPMESHTYSTGGEPARVLVISTEKFLE